MNRARQNDAMVVDDNIDPAKPMVPQLLRDLLLKLSVVRAIAHRGHVVTFGSHLSILKRVAACRLTVLPSSQTLPFRQASFLKALLNRSLRAGFNRAVCVPVLVEMQARMYLFL
jgi:hypothetical protein